MYDCTNRKEQEHVASVMYILLLYVLPTVCAYEYDISEVGGSSYSLSLLQ